LSSIQRTTEKITRCKRNKTAVSIARTPEHRRPATEPPEFTTFLSKKGKRKESRKESGWRWQKWKAGKRTWECGREGRREEMKRKRKEGIEEGNLWEEGNENGGKGKEGI